MPLLLKAQTHSNNKYDGYATYQFVPKHKPEWREFWEQMDGDKDKILEFAKNGDVERPEEWYQGLHKFLFDFFCGDERILLTAATKDFNGFLAQVAENHINDPKEKWWYIDKGLTQDIFIRCLERAADIPGVSGAVSYLNARLRDFGAELYSEYLLSRTKHYDELKSIASGMNRKAYEIEKSNGRNIMKEFVPGMKVIHAHFPNDKLTIAEVDEEVVVTEDENGHLGYVTDPWNLSIAFE